MFKGFGMTRGFKESIESAVERADATGGWKGAELRVAIAQEAYERGYNEPAYNDVAIAQLQKAAEFWEMLKPTIEIPDAKYSRNEWIGILNGLITAMQDDRIIDWDKFEPTAQHRHPVMEQKQEPGFGNPAEEERLRALLKTYEGEQREREEAARKRLRQEEEQRQSQGQSMGMSM